VNVEIKNTSIHLLLEQRLATDAIKLSLFSDEVQYCHRDSAHHDDERVEDMNVEITIQRLRYIDRY